MKISVLKRLFSKREGWVGLMHLFVAMALLIAVNVSYADEDKHSGANTDTKLVKKSGSDKKSETEDIMREISFLAKKLLDISGEDSMMVSSPPVRKPFIGVCSSIKSAGIKLTCITPESQADKNGLKTGDIVTSINGVSMAESDIDEDVKHPYWGITRNMQTGDVLKIRLIRGGQTLNIEVTVGSLIQPAYELKVNR